MPACVLPWFGACLQAHARPCRSQPLTRRAADLQGDRVRQNTFHKRKMGLIKKAMELTVGRLRLRPRFARVSARAALAVLRVHLMPKQRATFAGAVRLRLRRDPEERAHGHLQGRTVRLQRAI